MHSSLSSRLCRRRRMCQVLLSAAALPLGFAAKADVDFPAGPVRIVVPSSAGGVNDGVARALGQWLGEHWKVPFIVDNQPGGNGLIGARFVARANRDGYTLLMTPDSVLVMNPALYSSLPYDPVKDFEPITVLFKAVQVLVVHPAVPVKSVAELVAYARANPGKLTYASTGIGTTTHLNTEMIRQGTGIDITHIPFKGGAPALQAVIGGVVSTMIIAGNLADAYVKAGKLRAIAVMGDSRSTMFPGIPTFAESGLAGYKSQPWFGLLAPAGTPLAVIAKLNAGVRKALDDSRFRERFLTREGLEPVGGTPAEFASFIRTESARWAPIIKAAGVRIE